MTDKILVYPVLITHTEDKSHPYLVEIPVLDGMTEGDSFEDALAMAEDYIGTYSLDETSMPDSVTEVPSHTDNQTVSFVRVNISEYQRKHDNRVVKKTLTIPSYLNELGNDRGVNFSLILTKALKDELGV